MGDVIRIGSKHTMWWCRVFVRKKNRHSSTERPLPVPPPHKARVLRLLAEDVVVCGLLAGLDSWAGAKHQLVLTTSTHNLLFFRASVEAPSMGTTGETEQAGCCRSLPASSVSSSSASPLKRLPASWSPRVVCHLSRVSPIATILDRSLHAVLEMVVSGAVSAWLTPTVVGLGWDVSDEVHVDRQDSLDQRGVCRLDR